MSRLLTRPFFQSSPLVSAPAHYPHQQVQNHTSAKFVVHSKGAYNSPHSCLEDSSPCLRKKHFTFIFYLFRLYTISL